jgi:uncharacterized OB-fold protein
MNPNVQAYRCRSCDVVSYPAHCLCPSCGADRFETVPIEGEGVVLTYTDLYALAVDFEQRFLRLAIVEMDSGLRVTGQLAHDEPGIGLRVRATIDTVRVQRGVAYPGLVFVKA